MNACFLISICNVCNFGLISIHCTFETVEITIQATLFYQTLIPHFLLWVENPCTLATPLCFISEHVYGLHIVSHHTNNFYIYTRQWLRVLHWMNFIWWLGKCGTTSSGMGGALSLLLYWINIKNNCMEFELKWFHHCI